MSNEIKIGPVSNRADYSDSWSAMDEDNVAIDLTDATIVFEVADPVTGSIVVTGTVAISTTIFTVTIPRATMTGLDPQTYRVGCTIEQDDTTEQFFVGEFPVYDGVVSS